MFIINQIWRRFAITPRCRRPQLARSHVDSHSEKKRKRVLIDFYLSHSHPCLCLSLLPVWRLCVAPNVSARCDTVCRRAHQAGNRELRRAWPAAVACTRWNPHHHRRLPDALREQRRVRHAQGPRLRAGQERPGEKGIYSVGDLCQQLIRTQWRHWGRCHPGRQLMVSPTFLLKTTDDLY